MGLKFLSSYTVEDSVHFLWINLGLYHDKRLLCMKE